MNVKIYGAGSIGNHFAHASLRMGWNVDVYDNDEIALLRMKNDIYPQRYGEWNNKINLYNSNDKNKKKYDLIIIGTPPNTHLEIFTEIIKEGPKAVLIEKPLCRPSLSDLKKIEQIVLGSTRVFVGYNHVVSEGINKIIELINSGIIGEVITIDVEFRENWKGIFNAHPWLNGPEDSYLGFSEKGGGASGEHSHALNLWQVLSKECGFGNIIDVKSMLYKKNSDKVNYDEICILNINTESKKIGRVVQDVITLPVKKYALLEGTLGKIEWFCHYKQHDDLIKIFNNKDNSTKTIQIKKNRSDDFLIELQHIQNSILKNVSSPIDLEYGIETMKILEQVHSHT